MEFMGDGIILDLKNINVKIRGIESWREFFFYGFILCFIVAKAWGLTAGDDGYMILAMAGIAFWVATLYCIKFSQKEFIGILALMLIGGLILLFSGKLGVILPFLLISVSKGIEVEKVIRNSVRIWIGVFIFKIFLVLTGIVQNTVIYQRRIFTEGAERNSMGYGQPNLFHITFFVGITLFCYTQKKLHKKYYFCLLLLNFIVFRLSYSTTGWLLTTLAIMGFALIEYIEKHWVNYHSLAVIEGGACVIPMAASFLLAFIFNSDSGWWIRLNSFFTGRLNWNYLYVHQYSVPLLGQRFDGRISNILDNAYLFILYRYGILVFGLFLLGYVLVLAKCVKKDQLRKIFFCLLFLVYGFAEQFIQNCFMNFSMFFLCELMWKETKDNGRD